MPVGYVVARIDVDPEELKNWVAERVSAQKQLGEVILREVIPKSLSGKILRSVLRAREMPFTLA